jgi:polysaccharide biosynthesis transport protein
LATQPLPRLMPIPGEAESPTPAPAYVSGASTFDLRFILAAIRRRLWLLLAILGAAVALAVVATMLQSPRYTARSTLQINDQSDRILGEGEDIGQPINNYDTDRFLKTQVEVLRSRGLAARVANKLKLDNNPRFYRAMGYTPPAVAPSPSETREITIGLLQGGMDTDLPYDTRIVTISMTTGDPELSAEIANAFATEFIQANLQRRFDSSAYARRFVSDQLAEAKVRLANSERELNAYARQAGLIRTRDTGPASENTGSEGSVTTDSLRQINEAANTARAQRIIAEGRWRSVNSGPLLGSRDVLGNSTVQSLLTERAAVQAKLQEERARHLEDHPSVLQLRAQLAEINSQLQTVASSVRASIRSEYVAAQNAERALQSQVGSLKGATLAEQDRTVRYNLLQREADTNRTLYDGLLQRYNELNAAAGVSTSNVAIIDQADVPLTPSAPSLRRNIALALALGLLACAVVVFLAAQFDDAIRVPEDVENKLGLPLLGVIPRTDASPTEAMRDPKSPIAEGYNALRTSLMHSSTRGLPPVLLVTSAQPGEGKTTTSLAIASTLARLGKRTLLVDADLRRPAVHRQTGIANDRGLSDLLTSDDPLTSAVVASQEPSLSLLPSGPLPPSPTELTSSVRFQRLIDEMAERFEAVIIDSPPILGLADAPAMSTLVDGVVMVIESDRARRGGLKAALRRLQAMRPILLGAVLTKFDTSRAANRYSDYYGADYYEYKSEGA